MTVNLSDKLIAKEKSNWRKRIVDVEVEGESAQIEVRAPTAAQRSLALKEGATDAAKGTIGNLAAFQIRLVISCCYYPEGNEHAGKRVFSEADKDALMNLPGGGIVDDLATVASELMNGAEAAGKA